MTYHQIITSEGRSLTWPGSSAERAAHNATDALGVTCWPAAPADTRLPVYLIATLATIWIMALLATIALGRAA